MKKPTDAEPVATPSIEKRRMYSECLGGSQLKKSEPKAFKLTVKSKGSHGIEQMKAMVKTKLNPVEMRIGITTLKVLGTDD